MKKRKLHTIRGRFIAMFLVLALVLAGGVGALAYGLNTRQITQQYALVAANAASFASSRVDGSAIAEYLENGENAAYRATEAELGELKRAFGLRFLYVSIPDSAVNDAVYVFDIATDAADEGMICQLGEHTGETDVYDITSRVMRTGEAAGNAAITHGEFGYLISTYVPIKDSQGNTCAVMGVDMDMTQILREIRTQTFQISGFSFLLIIIFLLLTLLWVNRKMVAPINGLSQHMTSFDPHAQTLELGTYNVHTGDELEQMADSFNNMAKAIGEYVTNLKTITAEKERIATELSVATQIQAGMLPCIFPFVPEREEFDIYAKMNPAKEVGGDFYDFYLLDDAEGKKNRLGFIIADVSGKGVPAALFMVIAKTLIKNHAQQGETPAEIFTHVNNQLCESNDANMFVTAFMGMLDLKTGLLTFANAGHNQPLLRRKNEEFAFLTQRGGLVLGGMEGIRYKDHELQLNCGDRLFLYTDGVTEAQNEHEELFGDARLQQALNDKGTQNLHVMALLPHMRKQLDSFAGAAEQFDDITMLSLDYYGNTPGLRVTE